MMAFKRKIACTIYHFKTEIISFIDVENSRFKFLHKNDWWLKVSFLNNLFEKLNALNLSLQAANENIITITGKLKSFADKLELWTRKVQNSQLDCFLGINTAKQI